jgi:hypothetical protein
VCCGIAERVRRASVFLLFLFLDLDERHQVVVGVEGVFVGYVLWLSAEWLNLVVWHYVELSSV